MAELAELAAQSPVRLIQQDLGGPNRRGLGKVDESVQSKRVVRQVFGQPSVQTGRGSGCLEGVDDQGDGRGPAVALHLDGGGIALEHNRDDLIAESVADSA